MLKEKLIVLICFLISCSVFSQRKTRIVSHKNYEISNHLGNVTTVVSDRKQKITQGSTSRLLTQDPDIIAYNDYYPYGMLIERRNGSKVYRYGFQGQEQDDKIRGAGNAVNYTYRIHDTRVGRFFAVDPKAGEYSYNSSYAFSENIVINAIELEGGREEIYFYD